MRTGAGTLIHGLHGGFRLRKSVLAESLAFVMLGAQAQQQAGLETAAQQAIPDAPKPQTSLPRPGSIAPGKGISSTSSGDETPNAAGGDVPAAPAAAQTGEPVENQPNVSSESRDAFTLRVTTNFVDIP